MDEQRAAARAQTQIGRLQRVEAKDTYPGWNTEKLSEQLGITLGNPKP